MSQISELSDHRSMQMSDLGVGVGGGGSHLPTVDKLNALNKQTHSLACYQ